MICCGFAIAKEMLAEPS